ncbi:hypothetical protein NDA15_002511 [Ustilago hordei]|nr:hypothetical protein NDA15_002511 [Ustilago hordei]
MGVFELANIPADGKLIGVCWVFKLKLNTQRQETRYKARLVTQGQYGLYVMQLDVSTAFLNGKIDKDIYVQILPTFETDETKVGPTLPSLLDTAHDLSQTLLESTLQSQSEF